MSITTQLAAIKTKIETLEFGMVDTTEGRGEGLPWTDGRCEPLWLIRLTGSREAPDVKPSLGSHTKERVWVIDGFFPLKFDANSGARWLTCLEELEEEFDDGLKPEVCVKSKKPDLSLDAVMYKGGESGQSTLCHHVELIFITNELVT